MVGVKAGVIKQVEALLRDPRCINEDHALMQVEGMKGLFVGETDRKAIANRVSEKVRKRMGLVEIIHLALERLGRPAHYTDIAKECSEMFPERVLTPRNIHAVLCRDPGSGGKKLPWVWTGMRGVFALKEWGYKRPKLGLFDAVLEIVKQRYLKTQRPVAFTVIRAEMGKYRQVINEASLILACYCNDKITAVGKDQFVPFLKHKKAGREVSNIDKLDRQFRALKKIGIGK